MDHESLRGSAPTNSIPSRKKVPTVRKDPPDVRAAMSWVGKVESLIGREAIPSPATRETNRMQQPMPHSNTCSKEAEQRTRAMLKKLEKLRKTPAPQLSELSCERSTSSRKKRNPSIITLNPATMEQGVIANEQSLTYGSTSDTSSDMAPAQAPAVIFGMRVLGDEGKPQQAPLMKQEPVMRMEELLTLMDEMENGNAQEVAAVAQAATRTRTEQFIPTAKEISVNFEASLSYNMFLQEKDFWKEDNAGLGRPKTNLARYLENEKRERKHRENMELKLSREHAAEDAKMRFGMSTHEKQIARKRAEINLENTFAQERRRGVVRFFKMAPRGMVACALGAVMEIFLVFSSFLGSDGSYTKPPKVAVPESIILFSLTGAFACAVQFFGLFALYVILLVFGVRSQFLPPLCKVTIACQFLAKTAWCFAVVAFVLNFGELFDRSIDQVEEGNTNSIITAMIEIFCIILLLPTLLYIQYHAYTLLELLGTFVPRSSLHKHYAHNIELQLVLTAAILIINGSSFISRLQDFSSKTLHSILMYVSIGLGLLLFLFASAHFQITRSLRSTEEYEASVDDKREAIQASLRLEISDKNPCLVAHCPEKPSLVGLHGVVVGHGVDKDGLVTVSIDGTEFKMQEYQLVPDVPQEKQDEAAELAEYKLAALDYMTTKYRERQVFYISFYIVASQIFAGCLFVHLMALLRWDSAMSVRLYSEMVDIGERELKSSIEGINCTAPSGQMTEAQPEKIPAPSSSPSCCKQKNECTKMQRFVCSFWERCGSNSSTGTPEYCGYNLDEQCRVPLLPRETSGLGTAGSLAVGAAVAAVAGGLFVNLFIRYSLGNRGRDIVPCRTLTAGTIMGAIIFGALGTMLSHVISAGSEVSSRCDDIDLDSSQPGVQRLPLSCIVVTGAYFIEREISTESRVLILGASFGTLFFLLESTLRLATKVHELNRNLFAASEAVICFCFTIAALLFWGVLRIGDDHGLFDELDEWTNITTRFGYERIQEYGEDFPLTFDQTDELKHQIDLAKSIFMDWFVVFALGAVLVGIQVAGLYFTWVGPRLHPTSWMSFVKVILYINSFVHAYFVFVIFLCLHAVNIKYNILAFVLLASCVQYCFAMNYATQSDIWPVETGKGTITFAISLGSHIGPLLLSTTFFLGLALVRTDDRVSGWTLMILSGMLAMMVTSVVLLFTCNSVIGWALDTAQLVWSILFGDAKYDDRDFESETSEKTEQP